MLLTVTFKSVLVGIMLLNHNLQVSACWNNAFNYNYEVSACWNNAFNCNLEVCAYWNNAFNCNLQVSACIIVPTLFTSAIDKCNISTLSWLVYYS